jgi:hypothetical protein
MDLIKHYLRWGKQTQSFLLLELGLLSARLHSIEPRQYPVRIQQINEVPVQPGDFNSQLNAINQLASGDFPIREIVVVANSPSIHHQLVSLPPMKPADREIVLRRELKHFETPLEEQEMFSSHSFGRFQQEDQLVEHNLCAQVPKGFVESILEVLKNKGLQPVGFTTHTQMVCLLLRGHTSSLQENAALVEINSLEGGITLFRQGVWAMERRFLVSRPAVESGEEAGAEPEGMDSEKLLLEIGRSLQYFKQQFRTENIDQIFLYGSTTQIDTVRTLLSGAFNVPVNLLTVDPKKLSFIKPGRLSEESAALLFDIPGIASLHRRYNRYIDFLPRETKEERSQAGRIYLLAAAALVLYGILGFIWHQVRQEAVLINQQLHSAQSLEQGESQSKERYRQLLEQRAAALGFQRSTDWLQDKHHTLSILVRDLANLVPAPMTLSAFEAQEDQGAWQIILRAQIATPNGSHSQQLLQEFQSRLSQYPTLRSLHLADIEIIDSEEASDQSGSITRNLLSFSLNGQIAYSDARLETGI